MIVTVFILQIRKLTFKGVCKFFCSHTAFGVTGAGSDELQGSHSITCYRLFFPLILCPTLYLGGISYCMSIWKERSWKKTPLSAHSAWTMATVVKQDGCWYSFVAHSMAPWASGPEDKTSPLHNESLHQCTATWLTEHQFRSGNAKGKLCVVRTNTNKNTASLWQAGQKEQTVTSSKQVLNASDLGRWGMADNYRSPGTFLTEAPQQQRQGRHALYFNHLRSQHWQ